MEDRIEKYDLGSYNPFGPGYDCNLPITHVL